VLGLYDSVVSLYVSVIVSVIVYIFVSIFVGVPRTPVVFGWSTFLTTNIRNTWKIGHTLFPWTGVKGAGWGHWWFLSVPFGFCSSHMTSPTAFSSGFCVEFLRT